MTNAKVPEREELTVAGPAGPLECLLETPSVSGAVRGAALVCHPHPLHGGTMQNKVVHTLARAALDRDMAAMRFNFRGVGASAGSHDHGVGEIEDALAVAAELRQRFAPPLVVAGFSFGAAVAIEVARRLEPAALVSIAPAVDRWPRDDDWAQPRCPWLIVHGDADEIVAVDSVVEFANTLEPGPELLILPDVSHFFHGHLVALRGEVSGFLEASDLT
ncbi:MAG: alpha/beta fold hydrolase [Pseudomonadota bacterium]